MNPTARWLPIRSARWAGILLTAPLWLLAAAITAPAGELAVEDFTFDGPLGCQGARIEKLGRNHFKVTLGHAPQHTDWCNMLGFQILRNAKGNSLQLDVYFHGGNAYRFNHYPHSSWSCDGHAWHAIGWE